MFDIHTPTDPETHQKQIYGIVAAILLILGSSAFSYFYLDFMKAYHIDKLFHFLAGMAVYKIFEPYTKHRGVLVLCVLIIGIGWEVAEYLTLDMVAYYGTVQAYMTDVTGDILMDIFGPLIIWLMKNKRYLTRPS